MSLLGGDDLADDRFEPVVDHCADVEFAGLEHLGDFSGDRVGVLEAQPAPADIAVGADDRIGPVAAQQVPALAADADDFDRFARFGQLGGHLAGPAHDAGIETAAQAAVGSDRDEQVGPVVAGAGQHGRNAGPALQAGRQRAEHPVHALGIGPGSFRLLLRAAQLRGGDHLHRRRDLLRRLNARDAVAQVFEARHAADLSLWLRFPAGPRESPGDFAVLPESPGAVTRRS